MRAKVSWIDDFRDTPTRGKTKKRGRMTHKQKQDFGRSGGEEFVRNREPKPLHLKNENQLNLYRLMYEKDQTIVFGPSGVGKTYVAVSVAAEMYLTGKIKKIVITRPIVGTGKSIGALPGEKNEKMNPWLAEVILLLKERLGGGTYDIALKCGDIEIAPLEYIRGRSFSETFLFMTESQNSTVDEMKALVTRIGEDSKLVLDGDIRQTDLKGDNGLLWAIETIRDNPKLKSLSGIVEFNANDIVRSGLCAAWVRAIWNDR